MSDRQNPESINGLIDLNIEISNFLDINNQQDVYLIDLEQDTDILIKAGKFSFGIQEAEIEINLALDQDNDGQLDNNEIFYSTNVEEFVDQTIEIFNQTVSSGKYFIEYQLLNPSEATTSYFFDVNFAPTQLQFGLDQISYSSSSTLNLVEAWIEDKDGFGDLVKVDFWLLRPDGEWQDLKDVTQTDLQPWSDNDPTTFYDNDWASFEYSLDLSEYTAGEYVVWAQASDISGASSNEVKIPFTIKSQSNTANSAPANLQFGLNQTIVANGDFLSLTEAWIQDPNGSQDLQRVELWLQTPNGAWLELAQITDFQTWNQDNTWASFNYGIEINNDFQSGSYLVWAKGYDLSGATSNEASVSFEITSGNLA